MKKSLRIIALAMVALMLMLTLASCGAPKSNPDKALKALEKNDYIAQKSEEGDDDVECMVAGRSKDGTDYVTIIYYKTSAAAKEGFEDAKEAFEGQDDIIVKRSGKMVYAGTKEGIKAAS